MQPKFEIQEHNKLKEHSKATFIKGRHRYNRERKQFSNLTWQFQKCVNRSRGLLHRDVFPVNSDLHGPTQPSRRLLPPHWGLGSTLIQQQRLLRSDRRRGRHAVPRGDQQEAPLRHDFNGSRVYKIYATSNETTCQKGSDQRRSARLDEGDLSGNSMWSHTGVNLGYWCQINIKGIWRKSNSITWSVTDRLKQFNEISNT